MKRRSSSAGPAHLATFDVDAWAEPTDRPGFYRYERALHRWQVARAAWADGNGFEGDAAWWTGEHDAIVGMPDEPWDDSKV